MDKVPVSVIGLGKLGAPMVACFASKGHRVIGVDLRQDFVDQINQGRAPVFEPQLAEMLAAHRGRISATTDYDEAIQNSAISFIIVPTPSDEKGRFKVDYAAQAAVSIGRALRKISAWRLVVLTSTVLPGDTEKYILSALETHSGKRCGQEFGLCYNPEFIALGSVIRNLLNPDFTLIGEYDQRSGDMLAAFHQGIVDNDAPAVRMNIPNAELSKISVNTFVTTKISYANMLAELCERIPGCDADVVTSAIGLDSRIGRKYLKGAVAYGGPCFPRDNAAFAYMANSLGVEPTLAEATDTINRRQASRLARIVRSQLPAGGRVGILGLSYKPDTNVIEASQGVALANILLAEGAPVIAYDPAALDNARLILGDQISFAASLGECVQQSDVLVITTPWPEFKAIQIAHLARNGSRPHRPVILDCWRMFKSDQFSQVADYITLGLG